MRLVHALYEPAGDGPHPTVFALHGWGASGLDLLGLAPHLAAGQFRVVCPQGPVAVPIGPGMHGYGWFPISPGKTPDPAAVEDAYAQLSIDLDELPRRYAVDERRLALLGFSQGGVMAYLLALRRRARFAAVAALSTWLPAALAEGVTPDLAGLPVLVQHGTRDELITVERGRDSVDLLRGWRAEVTYREYDMGHEIGAASLRDLDAFLRARLPSRS
jgi:phospholipase/carboxylesterase